MVSQDESVYILPAKSPMVIQLISLLGGIFIASKGIVVGLGVGMTRDCTIIMIAQYFKKRREFVEVVTVAGSGLGIIVMSTFIQKSIDALGWR